MSSDGIALEARAVFKHYQVGERPITVLRNINLQIPSRQFVAVVGPSGSGKSTLLHLLGCLETPSAGTVSILGRESSGLSDDQISLFRCRAVGFVFQGFHLLPYYDALSNVALAMAYSGAPRRRERAESLLKKLGLGHRLHHRPRALSGGEQQRVAIARAVVNAPKILLADEPTGALDQANGRAILDLISDFHRQGKTVVLVTHDSKVAACAERIVEMVDGEIRDDRLLKR